MDEELTRVIINSDTIHFIYYQHYRFHEGAKHILWILN